MYISTKNWKKAISEYGSLYEECPDDPYIIEPLAKAYYEIGDMEKSKELYEKLMYMYNDKGDETKTERIRLDIERLFSV